MISRPGLNTLIAGIALILITNAIVLGGVAYNRSGEPDSHVVLTERELHLPYRYASGVENTGIDLQLSYRIKGSHRPGRLYLYGSANIPWLDRHMLASLDVDVSRPLKTEDDKRYYRKHDEKEVIFVLEYDGREYQAALKEAEEKYQAQEKAYNENQDDKGLANKLKNAKNDLASEQQSASRLFIVDAGLDREALRTKYTDHSKYLLLKGVMGIQITGSQDAPTLVGYVKSLSNTAIHVPLSGHKVLEPLMDKGFSHYSNQTQPRYAVTLNIGKRLEPWLETVEKL